MSKKKATFRQLKTPEPGKHRVYSGWKQLHQIWSFFHKVCLSGPLAAVKTIVLLSGSVSAGAAASLTLRNYSCTEVCPVL